MGLVYVCVCVVRHELGRVWSRDESLGINTHKQEDISTVVAAFDRWIFKSLRLVEVDILPFLSARISDGVVVLCVISCSGHRQTVNRGLQSL